MKVKTDYVPEDCNYLTAGKEYDAKAVYGDGSDPHLLIITDDNGEVEFVRTDHCAHLDGRAWEVVAAFNTTTEYAPWDATLTYKPGDKVSMNGFNVTIDEVVK